jgi:hypothetical protein
MTKKWGGKLGEGGLRGVGGEKSGEREKEGRVDGREPGYQKMVGYKAELNHDLIMSSSPFVGGA